MKIKIGTPAVLVGLLGIALIAVGQTGVRYYKCTTHYNDKFGCINGTIQSVCEATECETWKWTSPVKFCTPVTQDIWCTNNPPINPGVPYAIYSFTCKFKSHYFSQNECTCPDPGPNDPPSSTGATTILCP